MLPNLGSCVLTLGTGEHVRESDFPITLLPTLCYAVIGETIAVCRLVTHSLYYWTGVHDSPDGDRKLTIFDPWVRPSEDPAEAEASSSKQKRMSLRKWSKMGSDLIDLDGGRRRSRGLDIPSIRGHIL